MIAVTTTAMKVAGPPVWLALPVIFLLVAVILAGPAEMVGRCFARLEPLTAYRYDLLGSLLGIGTFTLLSFLRAPSVVWGAVTSVVFLALATGVRMRVLNAVSAVVVVGMLLSETLTAGVSWSPYYKVQTHPSKSGPGALSIWVNGVPHQTMAHAAWRLRYAPQQYGTPYEIYHQPATQGRFNAYPTWPSATAACVVEVDPETGMVRILRHCVVDDSGTVVNPTLVEANLHGATAQAIGGGLFERIAYDGAGQLQTATLMDYTIPTALEVPPITVAHRADCGVRPAKFAV